MKKMIAKIKPTLSQIIIWSISLLLTIGLFFTVKNFTACWRITALPGIVPQSCLLPGNNQSPTQDVTIQPGSTISANTTLEATNSALSAPSVELPPPWDGVERVTVLIIGLDLRDWEAGSGAPRSDTMMLLTLDPLNVKAGMMSVPRDMWVNIPDFGYNRINTAYSLGESWKLPGGGPGLAVRTVEDFLGIPISYYAQVDFNVFVRIIDEIGGILVTPEQDVTIDRIGENDIPITLKAGETVSLPGDLALGYARARKTKDGDIDRSKRQQQVILAVLDRFLHPILDYTPKILPLYNELSSGVNTNMSFEDAVSLLVFLFNHQDIEIQRGVIDYSMAVPITLSLPNNGGAADVLKPIPDKIRILRDQLFETGGSLSPLAEGDQITLAVNEAARILVYSSVSDNGITTRTSEYFNSKGLNTTSSGNSSEGAYKTVVIDHTGNPYTLQFLVEVMGLDNSQIRTVLDFNASSDVEIHIGNDWASNNPLP
jgi:polyisoprenyl-teichoic acid--peptidoglycan teichoic acid transferase